MPSLRLKTFQSQERVAQIEAEGRLVGDWKKVGGTLVAPSYRRMVQEMAAHGIDCGGHPPIWAWHGRVTLLDASLLLGTLHELDRGWSTMTFDAPADLVLLSDYGTWCDYFFGDTEWDPRHFRTAEERAAEDWAGLVCGVQATLPYLLREWVVSVRPLPTADAEELDLNTLV